MITKTDKFWVFFIIVAVMAKLSFATDNIVIIDTSNPSQKKTSTITITNNGVIHKTDAVTKESVQGTTTSAGAGDSGKIPKLNSGGKIDKTMMIGVPFTNMIVYSAARSDAEWTNSTACTFIMVECWGSGGGGGAGAVSSGTGGGGGGGGGYCRSYLNVGATNHFFVVGGGASTFLTMSAGGGNSGGTGGATAVGLPGAGGTASGGQENASGQAGTPGCSDGQGGTGGSGGKGGGGQAGGARIAGGNGTAGGPPGGGGGGGGSTSGGGGAGTGGAGSAGQVIIHFN